MAVKLFKGRQKQRPRMPQMRSGTPAKRPFSYYSSDNPVQPGRVERKGLRPSTFKRVRLIPTYLALVAIFGSIVYSTTLSTTPTIVFAGDPSPFRSTAEYKSLAEKILASSLLNHSKLTINTSSINNSFLAQAPELDAAKLVLPIIGRRPTLTLHARQPALILATKTNALIIDESGKAVSDARQLPSSLREGLLTLQDDSGLEVHSGDQAVTKETVQFILEANRQLKSKNLAIERLTLPVTPNEVDIHIQGLKYYVKADVTADVRVQIGSFLAVKDKLGSKPPGEYMDVRVEEKVFYK